MGQLAPRMLGLELGVDLGLGLTWADPGIIKGGGGGGCRAVPKLKRS